MDSSNLMRKGPTSKLYILQTVKVREALENTLRKGGEGVVVQVPFMSRERDAWVEDHTSLRNEATYGIVQAETIMTTYMRRSATAAPHAHSPTCDNLDKNIIQRSPRDPTELPQTTDGEITLVHCFKRMADSLLGEASQR